MQTHETDKSTYIDHYQRVIRNIAGGMGSISDLTLSSEGGHSVDHSTIREANKQKNILTEALYQKATTALAEAKKEKGPQQS